MEGHQKYKDAQKALIVNKQVCQKNVRRNKKTTNFLHRVLIFIEIEAYIFNIPTHRIILSGLWQRHSKP